MDTTVVVIKVAVVVIVGMVVVVKTTGEYEVKENLVEKVMVKTATVVGEELVEMFGMVLAKNYQK